MITRSRLLQLGWAFTEEMTIEINIRIVLDPKAITALPAVLAALTQIAEWFRRFW
jgi:hypothetical protein